MAKPHNARGLVGPLIDKKYLLQPHLGLCGHQHSVWQAQNIPKQEAISPMDVDPLLSVGQDIGRLKGDLTPYLFMKIAMR